MSTTKPSRPSSVVRDPRVYLVGRQTVDDGALAAFLADHDVRNWSTDTEVAGEKLDRGRRPALLHVASRSPGRGVTPRTSATSSKSGTARSWSTRSTT